MDTDSAESRPRLGNPDLVEPPRSWWYWRLDWFRAVFIYREFVPQPVAWLLCKLGRHEWAFGDGRCLWCGHACRCRKATY